MSGAAIAIAIAGLVALVGLIARRARRAGRAEERATQLEAALQQKRRMEDASHEARADGAARRLRGGRF